MDAACPWSVSELIGSVTLATELAGTSGRGER
jgi:hypothetical protein